jgi:hypothetical protein
VHARSTDSTDRPGHRPVGGCLAALAVIAPLVGSPPAFAADDPPAAAAAVVAAPQVEAPAAPDVTPPAPPDVAPPTPPDPPDVTPPTPPEPPSVTPPDPSEPPDVAPPEPPEVAPPAPPDVAPPDPPAAPDVDSPAAPSVDPPGGRDTGPDASPSAAANSHATPGDDSQPPAQPGDDEQPGGEPQAPPEQNALAVAGNSNMVFQVIWQIQQGCQTYCWGTSMVQGAVQEASTTQNAAAQAIGASSSTAQAGNESLTVQFAWQQQLGCVAFCYDTSQTQLALQIAETVQIAIALAGLDASADNLAETLQQVWQFQQGCLQECHGTSQTQIAAQQQTTSQTAIAIAEDAPTGSNVSIPPLPLPGDGGGPALPGWLIALALNVGATIQTIFQYEEAGCLNHCSGDSQSQWAGQQALTVQDAVAEAGAPAPPPDNPPAEPPVEQPVMPEPERVLAQAPVGAPSGDRPQAVSVRGPLAALRLSVSERGMLSALKHDPERRRTSLAMTVRRDSGVASTSAAFRGGGGEPPSTPPAAISSEPLDASFVEPIDVAPAPDRAPQQPAAAGLAPESSAADESDRRVLLGLLAGSLVLAVAGVSLMRRRTWLGA